jgi:hypothetical protein
MRVATRFINSYRAITNPVSAKKTPQRLHDAHMVATIVGIDRRWYRLFLENLVTKFGDNHKSS